MKWPILPNPTDRHPTLHRALTASQTWRSVRRPPIPSLFSFPAILTDYGIVASFVGTTYYLVGVGSIKIIISQSMAETQPSLYFEEYFFDIAIPNNPQITRTKNKLPKTSNSSSFGGTLIFGHMCRIGWRSDEGRRVMRLMIGWRWDGKSYAWR